MTKPAKGARELKMCARTHTYTHTCSQPAADDVPAPISCAGAEHEVEAAWVAGEVVREATPFTWPQHAMCVMMQYTPHAPTPPPPHCASGTQPALTFRALANQVVLADVSHSRGGRRCAGIHNGTPGLLRTPGLGNQLLIVRVCARATLAAAATHSKPAYNPRARCLSRSGLYTTVVNGGLCRAQRVQDTPAAVLSSRGPSTHGP